MCSRRLRLISSTGGVWAVSAFVLSGDGSPCPMACANHGTCTAKGCVCDAGYTADNTRGSVNRYLFPIFLFHSQVCSGVNTTILVHGLDIYTHTHTRTHTHTYPPSPFLTHRHTPTHRCITTAPTRQAIRDTFEQAPLNTTAWAAVLGAQRGAACAWSGANALVFDGVGTCWCGAVQTPSYSTVLVRRPV